MKSIHIVEETLPFAWERAVVKTWEEGEPFPTQYDQKERGDPHSRDVIAMIHVTNPMKEPRIHRGIIGGLNDIEKYRLEVVAGVHDYLINPKEGKWSYTYHQRLFEYEVPGLGSFNQIEQCIAMLKKCGYTRRAQAITWKVWEDLGIDDPSCLQRIWLRIQDGKKLNMVTHMRSQDSYKAAFFNYYAWTELQNIVAQKLGVDMGSYISIVDSFHIYGSDFEQFKGFLKTIKDRTPENRVYTTKFSLPFFVDGCNELLQEEKMPEDKKQLVKERRRYLLNLQENK